ncbi:MAG TPA: tetratricopeptide repeat protein [Chitinophagaceae bacterium]|jgi:Ca-activated chloride channel family protein
MIRGLVLFMVVITGFSAQCQLPAAINKGNEYYRQQQYDKAAEEYQRALQANPQDRIAKFDLSTALIRQNKQDEAASLLQQLTTVDNKPELREKASYNQGVMASREKKLEESIEDYKAALRLDPTDNEARENLQKALLELKKKNPPKKQDEKKNKPQQQQPKPKMSQREAQQQLKLLEQKEKEVQERIQKNNSKTGSSQPKDW